MSCLTPSVVIEQATEVARDGGERTRDPGEEQVTYDMRTESVEAVGFHRGRVGRWGLGNDLGWGARLGLLHSTDSVQIGEARTPPLLESSSGVSPSG